jgi:hypothetical protein
MQKFNDGDVFILTYYENRFDIATDSDIRDYPKPVGTPPSPPKDPFNPTGTTPTGNTDAIVGELTNNGNGPRTGFGNSNQIAPGGPPRGTAEP